MKAKLDSQNLDVLRDIRRNLLPKDGDKEVTQWNTFDEALQGVNQACEDRDLAGLASSVRRMKNLLRRPHIKKQLAQLEGKKEDENQKTGVCKCSNCGKLIDGTEAPCVKGVLCIDCAMKQRDKPSDEEQKDKEEKKAKSGTPFPPEMIGGGAGGEEGQDGEDVSGQETEPEDEPVEKKKKKKKKTKKEWLEPKKMRLESKLRCRNYVYDFEDR